MARASVETVRQDILGAASALFARHGYRGTSIADIAAQVGCAKATVLYHFAGKDALLAALLADPADELATMLGDVETLPVARRRAVAARGLLELALRHRELVVVLRAELPATLRAETPCDSQQPGPFEAVRLLLDRLLAALTGPDPSGAVTAVLLLDGIPTAVCECAPGGILPSPLDEERVRAELTRVLDLLAPDPSEAPDTVKGF